MFRDEAIPIDELRAAIEELRAADLSLLAATGPLEESRLRLRKSGYGARDGLGPSRADIRAAIAAAQADTRVAAVDLERAAQRLGRPSFVLPLVELPTIRAWPPWRQPRARPEGPRPEPADLQGFLLRLSHRRALWHDISDVIDVIDRARRNLRSMFDDALASAPELRRDCPPLGAIDDPLASSE